MNQVSREVRKSDLSFHFVLKVIAAVIALLFLTIFVFLFQTSKPAIDHEGFLFFVNTTWSPTTDRYGVLAFIYGTVVSSVIALILAVPVSVGSALFLTQISPSYLLTPLRTLIELLAAVPSVVYGLWGIFILAPFVKNYLQPFLREHSLPLPFFQGPAFGLGLFTAGLILAIMIIPTITTISMEVLNSVPKIYREGAKALGATDWEAIRMAVLKPAVPGILSAIALGFGRAMGETMAVTMVIGNRPDISPSLFSPASTMASVIANEYAEAGSNLHSASLTAVGLTLLFVSVVINILSRIVVRLTQRGEG